MLALFFFIKETMYIIKCQKVREIAPMVQLKEVPHAPDFFAGYFNYRGAIVPVIDLGRLIQGEPSRMRLSTRIILVDYQGEREASHVLGLIAERVTDVVKRPESAFVRPGIRSKTAPYLGGIVMEEGRMVQYIDLDLLPDCVSFLPESERKSCVGDGQGQD